MFNHQNRDETEKHSDTAEADNSGTHKEPPDSDVRSTAQRAIRRASLLGRTGWKERFSAPGGRRMVGLGLLLGALVIVAVVAYSLLNNASPPATTTTTTQRAPAAPGAQPPESEREERSGLSSLFGAEPATPEANESWPITGARITLRLALGALLAALLAFRPRRDSPVLLRNPYVAQTQILLAVVAAALMMIVSDNAARAFGIFAAASLVRFRTNIRDPKEITVLLISLGIGLATGVGKIEVAIILSLFVLLVLSLLEYYEPEQIFRAMELTIATRKVDETDEALREIFDKRNITSELRKVDREDSDNAIGKIVYYVNVAGDLSTDKLSEEVFSADPDNIDSIQWDQKKSSSYIYR